MKLAARIATVLLIILGTAFMLIGEPGKVPDAQDATENAASSDGTTSLTITPTPKPAPFTFASMGDAQNDVTNFNATVDQIEDLSPDLVIFNGDLESDGVVSSEMDPMTEVLKKDELFNKTFLVRGNHDDHESGSAALWENYFQTPASSKSLPNGVTEYVPLGPDSQFLSYSFIYGNSIFIGLDDPGNAKLLKSNEYDFLDARLTKAENEGLTHAFLFFHGPIYCVESTHCSCPTKTDSRCTPESLIKIINKHPIVSATFHGHEHILGWTHMDSTRLAGLSGHFEQFITSPSGGWTYNDYLFPDRMDYYVPDMDSAQGFAFISINGNDFTFSLYKTNEALPVWSKSFSK